MNHFFESLTQCFCFPQILYIGISVVLFFLAYVSYRILLFIFRKVFWEKRTIYRKLVEALRLPILFIFYEIVAVVSINILGIRERYEEIIHHAIVVFFIGTFGWVLGIIIKTFFLHFMARLEKQAEDNLSKRSLYTQVLLLYRVIMFFIILITISAILISFPYIKSFGVGILGSAGIAGIALGIAARPILLNLMAGFQIAITKTIKIGDAIQIQNEFARIESIHLTHVITKTWDLRRIILPISYFIDNPFQNWDAMDRELLGSVILYCDYSLPVDALRSKVEELLETREEWNRKSMGVHVTNCSEKTMEIRVLMSANDSSNAFELRCFIREKLIEFLQKEYPFALPCVHVRQSESLST